MSSLEQALLDMGVSQEAVDALVSEKPTITVRQEPSRSGWSVAIDGRQDLGEEFIPRSAAAASPGVVSALLIMPALALAKRWCEAWEKSR